MTPLLAEVLEAHGGLARWRSFTHLSAQLQQGGALWALKGQPDVLSRSTVTVDLGRQQASHTPFGAPGRYSRYSPERVSLHEADGQVIAALDEPRASFAGHALATPWSALQLAYFAGCAMWTYLNTPFLLAWDGVQTSELEPWQVQGQTWRRLQARFPDHIATHSREQTLYVDAQGLLTRHDYDVEIAGNTPGAHCITGYTEVQGLRFPTARRIYPRGPDGQALPEPLVVSIDLSHISLR